MPQCEGFRRYGAFQQGGGSWQQCQSKATHMVRVEQQSERKTFPACAYCLAEAKKTSGIIVISVKSIKPKKKICKT